MQLRLIPAILLFLGSYFPLSVILLFQNMKESYQDAPLCKSLSVMSECELPILLNADRVVPFFVITFVSLLFFFWCLKQFKGQYEVEIIECKTIPNDLINYVFPYVVSFMGLDVGDTGKFIGFLLFMGWMFLLTYRSGQILMNPLLLATGWQLYDIKGRLEMHTRDFCALAEGRIVPGDKLKSCLVQGIYVLSKVEKGMEK